MTKPRSLRTVRAALASVPIGAGPPPSTAGRAPILAWLRRVDADLEVVNVLLRERYGVSVDVAIVFFPNGECQCETRVVDGHRARISRIDEDRVLCAIAQRLDPTQRRPPSLAEWMATTLLETEARDSFFRSRKVLRVQRPEPRRARKAPTPEQIGELLGGVRLTAGAFPKGDAARAKWLSRLDADLGRINDVTNARHGVRVEVLMNFHPSVMRPEIRLVDDRGRSHAKLLALVAARVAPGPIGLKDALRLVLTTGVADETTFERFSALQFGFDS